MCRALFIMDAAQRRKLEMIKRLSICALTLITLTAMCGMPVCAFASDSSQITKEETVYVVTDADGTQNDVIVSDHLINSGGMDVINDSSELEDIENVKGEEKFTQDGGSLKWKSGGNDIYYQGRTDAEVPISMDVSYKLDGKEISGADLQGKSGNAEINITYSNSAEYNGDTVPFIVMTGLIVTDDSFTDISIDNGKVINDGDKTIVAGMAAPGLAQTLGFGENELGLGDSVKITGTANEFAVEDMMTIVTNSVFEDIDTGKFGDLNYDAQINELNSGAKKLVSGSKELYSGIDYLNSQTDPLEEGVSELNKGSKQMKNGLDKLSGQLTGKLEKMQDSVETLYGYSGTLYNGMVTLRGGLCDARDGAGQAAAALQQSDGTGGADISNGLNGAMSYINASYGALTDQSGGSIVQTGAAAAAVAAQSQTNAAVKESAKAKAEALKGKLTDEEYAKIETEYEALIDEIDKIDTGTQAASTLNASIQGQKTAAGALKNGNNQSATTLISSVKGGLSQISGKLSSLQGGLDKAVGSLGSVDKTGAAVKGNTLLYVSYGMSGGLYQMSSELGNTLDKNSDLNKGITELKTGAKDLAKGMGKLDSKTGKLVSGVDELDAGSLKLSNGMSKLYKEGISQIVSLYKNDIKGLVNGFDNVADAGQGYRTFTKLPEGMDGNVKFIYKTEIAD